MTTLIGGFLAYALPVFQLPPAKPLGTFTLFLSDPSRTENYAATPGGERKFVTELWYPADTAALDGQKPQSWSPDLLAFGAALAKSQGWPSFFLSHLGLVQSHAYTDAKPDGPNSERYPVVIYSHGWGGFRTVASNQVEALASAGFIVIAPDHSYGAAGTVFPDGTVVLNNPKAMPAKNSPTRQQGIETLVDSYAGDLKYIIDTLPKLDSGEIPSPLKGRIDLDRIGIFGHSTGGGAVIEEAKADPRVKAVAGLDIWCEPVSPPLRTNPRDIPIASIRSQDWYENRKDVDTDIWYQILASFTGPKYDLFLANSKHVDFTVVPLLSPFMRVLMPDELGPIPAEDAIGAVDNFLVAFFTQYLEPDKGVKLPNLPATIHPALQAAVAPNS